MSDYADTGKILYIFRDFPLPGQPQSSLAAEGANCAGEVGGAGAYWDMHDMLFDRQAEWSRKGEAGDIIKGYAVDLGLDAAAFSECLDTGATRTQVEKDVTEGRNRGVRGTPTFFINGVAVVGAQPYSTFAKMIDADAGEPTQASSEISLAPATALSSEVQALPEDVQEVYRFALANPEILSKIPCYCGCVGVNHMSNLDCYVQSLDTDGKAVFDDHAAT